MWLPREVFVLVSGGCAHQGFFFAVPTGVCGCLMDFLCLGSPRGLGVRDGVFYQSTVMCPLAEGFACPL